MMNIDTQMHYESISRAFWYLQKISETKLSDKTKAQLLENFNRDFEASTDIYALSVMYLKIDNANVNTDIKMKWLVKFYDENFKVKQ